MVVWAPDFDEKSGGTIVLHLLAHMMRDIGVEVYLSSRTRYKRESKPWAFGHLYAAVRRANRKRRLWRRIGKKADVRMRWPWHVATHVTMPIPTMPDMKGRRFIAVYPEIVDGNPLGADFVARWLLYHPDFHAPGTRFTDNELVVFYQPAFVPEGANLPEDHHLSLHWVRDDLYQDQGLANRHGTCRMVRKGKATFDPAMAEGDRFGLLDHMPHKEIAEIFNQCDVFVSHDLYTLYLYYAARCGCVPMVVPEPGLDAASWRAGYEFHFGVAYGEAELDWARQTRGELMAEMAALREREWEMVRTFVGKLAARFLPAG
ncbi:MAG TPA: hypothetical protein VK146_16395 [Tabrizicola sp.]|nr:hypothetical protein [Tabrizicola sp.]